MGFVAAALEYARGGSFGGFCIAVIPLMLPMLPILLEAGEVPAAEDRRNLSMGMSNDFEIAVEEGATLVRPGTVLFEGIEG